MENRPSQVHEYGWCVEAATRAHGLLAQTMSDDEVDEIATGAFRLAGSSWVEAATRAHGLLAQTMSDDEVDEMVAPAIDLGGPPSAVQTHAA